MIPRGPRTESLTREQIRVVREWADKNNLTAHSLRTAMEAPCTWKTIQRALDGKPIAERFARWFTQWIDAHRVDGQPASLPLSGKDRASGEREDT